MEEIPGSMFGHFDIICDWLHHRIEDIVDEMGWLFQTALSQVSNREIASCFLLLVFAILVLRIGDRPKIIEGFGDIIACIFKPIILIPATSIILYSLFIVFVFEKIGIWSPDILLDTITEILFVGLPGMAIAVKSKSITSVFRRLVLPEIRLGAAAAFYINAVSFSIPVELIIQFVIALCVFGKADSKRPADKKKSRIADGVLAISGFMVLGATTFQIANSWSMVDWTAAAKGLAMAIWYPVSMMPFIIVLSYCSAFSTMRARVKACAKQIGLSELILLALDLFPSMCSIANFTGNDARQYQECHSLRTRHQYCKTFKRAMREKMRKERKKLKRFNAGKGKRGFDETGLWLDWQDLETIKSDLKFIANIQDNKWNNNQCYSPDTLSDLMDKFTPRGCFGESYVSADRKIYACWMTNGTGFTFGIGTSNGSYPPLRYEGIGIPSIDPNNPLLEFVPANQQDNLPNWSATLKTNESYC